jgi:hypothetical protein
MFTTPLDQLAEHALFQRQKYQAIKENCDLTKRKINHALSLFNADSECTHAYRGIFTTLKTMLIKTVLRPSTPKPPFTGMKSPFPSHHQCLSRLHRSRMNLSHNDLDYLLILKLLLIQVNRPTIHQCTRLIVPAIRPTHLLDKLSVYDRLILGDHNI